MSTGKGQTQPRQEQNGRQRGQRDHPERHQDAPPHGTTTRPKKSDDAARATDYLANERTFLAWLRTSVALIALGFVVARFGLLLRELAAQATMGTSRVATTHISNIFGTAIVILAALLLVLSYVRYRRADRAIARGEYSSDPLLVTVSVIITVAISLLLAAFLLLTP